MLRGASFRRFPLVFSPAEQILTGCCCNAFTGSSHTAILASQKDETA